MCMMSDIEFHDADIQELTFEEMEDVSGGNPLLVAAAGIAIGAAIVYVGFNALGGFIDGVSGNESQVKRE